jgi:hypothetical protein
LIVDLTITVLGILAVFFGVLWLLLLWFGDSHANPVIPGEDDPILGPRDQVAVYESHGPFIPMPKNLTTQAEMVAWMTEELPKLTAGLKPKA